MFCLKRSGVCHFNWTPLGGSKGCGIVHSLNIQRPSDGFIKTPLCTPCINLLWTRSRYRSLCTYLRFELCCRSSPSWSTAASAGTKSRAPACSVTWSPTPRDSYARTWSPSSRYLRCKALHRFTLKKSAECCIVGHVGARF